MSDYIKREDVIDAIQWMPTMRNTRQLRPGDVCDRIMAIPAAELPERCIAKITFDEDKLKEIADEAIREVVVRCTECRHRRLCDQCTEQNGKMYHIEWCSRGEREE